MQTQSDKSSITHKANVCEPAKPHVEISKDDKLIVKDSEEESASEIASSADANQIYCLEVETPFLEVIFDAHGEDKRVKILKRPLGAEFSKKSNRPVQVSKVRRQSYASRLGIEVGWVLKCIGGEDVSLKTFQETQEVLKSGLLALPDNIPL